MKRDRCGMRDCARVYELTAFYEGGGYEVVRVPGDDVDAAVAGLEDQPDIVSVGIREDA